MSSEEVETTAIERVDPQQKDMNVIVVEAEARALLLKRVLPELLKVCNERNIRKFGDTMYIDNDGCQKIARIVGVSYSQPVINESYNNDPDTGEQVYCVRITGEAKAFGQEIFEFGGATSKDKFYENRKISWNNLCLEVMKKALANWQGRCVRTLLGIKEYTEEELNNAGFNTEKMGRTEYKQGRNSGSEHKDAKSATSDVKGKIQAQIMDDVGGNQKAYEFILSELTAFQGERGWVEGKKDVSQLTDKWAFRLWSEIRPDGKKRDEYQDKVYLANQQFAQEDQSVPTNNDVPF